MRGTPVAMSASVSPASGLTASLDSRLMQAPQRSPMEIDEIRFQLRHINTAVNTGSMGGGILRARFKLGRLDLTNDYVPIWNLSDRVNLLREAITGAADIVVTGNAHYSYYRWKFPYPLYVPGSMPLHGSIQRVSTYDADQTALDSAATVRVFVTYVGRILKKGIPVPTRIRVPYATGWVSTTPLISDEISLRNVLSSPLHVTRFTGHIQNGSGSTLRDDAFPDIAAGFNTMRIYDTSGRTIANTAGIRNVIDPNTAGWSMNATLAPGEGYRVQLSDAPSATYRPMFALLGWRWEDL